MKTLVLVCVVLFSAMPAQGQTLDLDRYSVTADARILEPEEYLPEAVLQAHRQTGVTPPGRVMVGSANGFTVLHREGTPIVLISMERDQAWTGMARQNSWTVECDKDAMDDTIICRLNQGDLFLILRDHDELSILVGLDHYPETGVALRIDEGEPFQSAWIGFVEPEAGRIVDQLLGATTVRTRMQQWPSRANVDRELDLAGFPEAYEMLRWLIERIE